jgi:hypothetical protein
MSRFAKRTRDYTIFAFVAHLSLRAQHLAAQLAAQSLLHSWLHISTHSWLHNSDAAI